MKRRLSRRPPARPRRSSRSSREGSTKDPRAVGAGVEPSAGCYVRGVASDATPTKTKHQSRGNRCENGDAENHRPGLVTPTLHVSCRDGPDSEAAENECRRNQKDSQSLPHALYRHQATTTRSARLRTEIVAEPRGPSAVTVFVRPRRGTRATTRMWWLTQAILAPMGA